MTDTGDPPEHELVVTEGVRAAAKQLVTGAANALGDRFWAIAMAISLVIIVGVAFGMRWHVLTSDGPIPGSAPFPVGIDGYFYPIQVRSVLEHGVLRYPASPLTFYWMVPFTLIAGPIAGAKLGAALGGALIAIPAYGIGKRFGEHRGAGLVSAVLAATTATSCFLAFEFVKQAIGLTVALCALWAILVAIEQRTRRSIVIATFTLALAFATHKLAAALVLVIIIPEIALIVRRELFGRRLIYVVLVVIGAATASLLLGIIAPKRFVSITDLSLIKDLVSSNLHLTAPALVMDHYELAYNYEPLIAGLLSIAALALLSDAKHKPTAIAVCIAGIVIALPFLRVDDPQGLGFRLRVASFVPLALAAAIVARKIPQPVAMILAAVLLMIEATTSHPDGLVKTHPVLSAAVENARGKIPDGKTVIIGERHILYMVDWYTGAEVSLRPEPVPLAQRIRMLGLVMIGGQGSSVDRALDAARTHPELDPPIGLHAGYRNGLVLVPEPTWNWILQQLPQRAREFYAPWPVDVFPASQL
ncbi:MAG: glycosyltransferase family 39 protein [Kofleriaceae bacterium]